MANWILHRIPDAKTSTTPFELFNGYPISLDKLKVRGCLVYVHIPDIRRPKAIFCVFLRFIGDYGSFNVEGDPHTYAEAMKSKDAVPREEAVKEKVYL